MKEIQETIGVEHPDIGNLFIKAWDQGVDAGLTIDMSWFFLIEFSAVVGLIEIPMDLGAQKAKPSGHTITVLCTFFMLFFMHSSGWQLQQRQSPSQVHLGSTSKSCLTPVGPNR